MSWFKHHLGLGLPQPLDPPIAAATSASPSCGRRRAFPGNTRTAHPDPLPALAPFGTATCCAAT